VAKLISASKGGEVATEGASLDIPAGALGEDTEVTVEVVEKDGLADEENIASDVYDFGPDGTTFEKPVTLTIDFDASATPDGMTAVMAFLDGDAWEPLADSEVSGDMVTATTTHFTLFAIVWTADGGMQTEGMCEDTFEPCGGDIVGDWEISLGCITFPPALLGGATDGPLENCMGASVVADADITGTVTFGADGMFSAETEFTSDVTITLPKSCLPMGATCMDVFDNAEMPGTDTGDACEQKMLSSNPDMGMGTYEVDEAKGTLTMTQDGMTDPPAGYCVSADGKTLTVHMEAASEEDPEILFVATKK
jgi:hypothetical protein